MKNNRGFTQSLKFALGGLSAGAASIRTAFRDIRGSFHGSPREDGMPLPAKANSSAGFTLIELLVVIAIIGILSSVVLASLNSARKKGRDARRIADVRQLQLALELYYDKNNGYPQVTDLDSSTIVADGFLSAIPHDPSDQRDYSYAYTTNGGDYHLGASLEDSGNSAKNSDADCTSAAAGCFAAAATGGFNGADTGKCNASDTGTLCYDVTS